MYVRKILITRVTILVLSSFFFSAAYCGEEFPEWVPKGAIEKAKRSLNFFSYFHNEIGSIYAKDPNRVKIDSIGCILKNPFEAVRVDYVNYSKGDRISDHFSCKSDSGKYIGFGVYYGDEQIGYMEIILRDGEWILGFSGGADSSTGILSELYDKYPPEKGYKIISQTSEAIFFIEKDNRVIQILEYTGSSKGWVQSVPEQYMLKNKKEILFYKRAYSAGVIKEVPEDLLPAAEKILSEEFNKNAYNYKNNLSYFQPEDNLMDFRLGEPYPFYQLNLKDIYYLKDKNNFENIIQFRGWSVPIYLGNEKEPRTRVTIKKIVMGNGVGQEWEVTRSQYLRREKDGLKKKDIGVPFSMLPDVPAISL
jgi:hypothetical protein